MNFKERLKKDLDIFVNVDEFGDLHILGKKEVLMVIEEDSLNELPRRNDDFSHASSSIYEAVTTIYLKASDYKKPAVGKRIKLDDEDYYVVQSSVSDGLLKITLSANESYG